MAISPCATTTDSSGRELVSHGTLAFPAACYDDDLTINPVHWHWHEELEFAIMLEGEAYLRSGTKKYLLRPGEGLFTNSGILHDGENAGTSKCHLHSIVFHPHLIAGSSDSVFWKKYIHPLLTSQELECVFFSPEIPVEKEILTCFERAWEAIALEMPGYEFLARENLSRLLYLLISTHPASSAVPSEKAHRNDERIKGMMQFIQANFSQELTISDIAASATLSVSECLRCFRHTIGTTPIQYLKNYRLQRAAHLLLSTHSQISEIAVQCGFQEMSYFAKSFRALYGSTPSDYRKKESGAL